MKKYFMLVAVAAAGMLASCSSDSLTAGSEPKIEPTQEESVPIKINVATPQLAAKGATRGMGTVGDEEGGSNFWYGEKVNVFMFNKGSLTLATEDGTPGGTVLYDNVALTTPTGVTSDVAVELNGAGNVITYKYYPVQGNFDFWGYFRDDALPAAAGGDPTDPAALPVTGASEVTVPFEIDGSQDLMVAKTVIDVDGADAAAVTAIDAADNNDDTKVSPTREHSTRYYSAFAARRGLQPNLNFQHLLTRLTFSIYGADNETCGFEDKGGGVYGLPVDGSTFEGVFVKSIKVKSKATGEIIAAYTGDPRTPSQLISFDTTGGTGDDGYYDLFLKSKRNPVASTNPVTPLYPGAFDWDDKADIRDTKLIIDADDSGENANWKYILRPLTTAAGTANTIGGALMVSPETSYDLEIEIGQCLLKSEAYPVTNPSTTPTYEVKYATFPYTITPTPTGTPATTQGVSYNVKIKLYGFEKIEITTTLEEWKSGEDISFEVE